MLSSLNASINVGEGAESAEPTGNQGSDPQTINSSFPIGISFLKQRSTMLCHQGFGRSAWEGEAVGGAGREGEGEQREKRIVHFPRSSARGYQVLRSTLREILSLSHFCLL